MIKVGTIGGTDYTGVERGVERLRLLGLHPEVELKSISSRKAGGSAVAQIANRCSMTVHRPHGSDMLVVLSVIDNLIKGTSGQAVQNMNIMFGLPEILGLEMVTVAL